MKPTIPDQERTLALLRLALTPHLGPILIARVLEAYPDPASHLELSVEQWCRIDGIGPGTAERIRRGIREVDAQDQFDRAIDAGADVVPITSPDYPALLKAIPDPPPVLFVKGTFGDDDPRRLAVVGTRRCSAYGRDVAGRFSAALAEMGVTIVSGGARGIDTAAHQGALRVRGRTIAVLGCGLGHVYPKENAELFERIAAEGGAVVSEFPIDTPPTKENFPRRNRIISGLSLATLVVEAPSGSGALITARNACEDHNRDVMAIPGRVDWNNSAGCHRIIQEGWAKLVTTPEEIHRTLVESSPLAQGAFDRAATLFEPRAEQSSSQRDESTNPTEPPLTDVQRRILDALNASFIEIDELALRVDLDPSRLQVELTMLELSRLIERAPGAGVRRRLC